MKSRVNLKNILIALLLSVAGFAYLTYYIFRASVDVVASDYIRIINYYLPDVTDLKYLLSWEGIANIPFAFLMRYINVKFFNYSVFFDKIVGLVGLMIFNFVTVKYALENLQNKYIKIIVSIIITFISFSLMAWEMILNGTGYPHFITIGLIALTFNIVGARPLLIIITSLLFAGSYSVAYLATLILFSVISIIATLRVKHINVGARPLAKPHVGASYASPVIIIIVSLICLALYYKSSHSGEQLVPVGFQDVTLKDIMEADATFPVRFFLSSFASALIGVETLMFAVTYGTITNAVIFIIGIVYIIIMLWALFVGIRDIISEKHRETETRSGEPMPYLYIVYGLISVALIFLARYRFVRADYGMSSRYAIQYMFLTIGIILILSKKIDTIISRDKSEPEATHSGEPAGEASCMGELREPALLTLIVSALAIFILVFGHIITTTDEMYKTDNRKLVYEFVENVAKNYHDYTDEQLMGTFEYFRSAEHIKNALGTLEDNHLNVFR